MRRTPGGLGGNKKHFLMRDKNRNTNIEMSRRYSCQSAVALTFISI